MMGAAGAASDTLYVDDVFSTFLYEGDQSARSINNGIDLSGEGGLVWFKNRNNTQKHVLFDTERGAGYYLSSNETSGNSADSARLTQFNNNGFAIGTDADVNGSSKTYTSWTFRKAPGFFDIVTYTGNDTGGHTIPHSLGSVPGCVIVKRTDSSDGWSVYHKNTQGLFSDPANNLITGLHSTNNASGSTTYWNDTTPTDSVFTLGSNSVVNGSGMNYIAYVFASEEPVFGKDGDESIIKCGGYTGNGTSGSSVNSIDLGFEPQWVMIKKTSGTGSWLMLDTMRGFTTVGVQDEYIHANSNSAASVHQYGGPTSTGFQVEGSDGDANGNGAKYIYIAIRRPHKPPESGTEVFAQKQIAGSGDTQTVSVSGSSVTDMTIIKNLTSNSHPWVLGSRILGAEVNKMDSNQAGTTSVFGTSVNVWDQMVGTELRYDIDINRTGNNYMNWQFTRKPGFFDVVAYTGNGVSGHTVPHNLGVVPEMMWIRTRNTTRNWRVYDSSGATGAMTFPTDAAKDINAAYFSTPTADNIILGTDLDTNGSNNHIAYLFATLPGISKIGTFSGTGSDINVDCGFTAGARFVIVKRTDSSGDWYVFDTERGINPGNDSYMLINSQANPVTNTDYIDPLNAGFTITSSAPAGLNTNGGTYMFFAIA